ncbi:MAG TPA: ligase-associated DNA damage response exonuclease [Casimicrobiaceae bacterium]|nr:ligase-associated DNA damage response exonuclease [Casimicrobiaceae bacterium]
MDLIAVRPEGLYCAPGDFFIDPWRPVDRAVITHAHGDHARSGSAHYLAAQPSRHVLQTRLGDVALETLAYGARRRIRDVTVSLHPAGHVLGSAQVRIAHRGETWVVSGDYKLDDDPTCDAFEPVRCDTFISESTFGLPIYRWHPPSAVIDDVARWWRSNADAGRASVLFCYAFGKAQRVLAGLAAAGALDIGTIVLHGAIAPLNRAYRATGVMLPEGHHVTDVAADALRRALVLAPPSAAASPWLRRFGDLSDGFASGWMQLRGARKRRGVDRGFVLSDHADWAGLNAAIDATGASRVIVTHGQVAIMVRWLIERGLAAQAFETEFDNSGENDVVGADAPDADALRSTDADESAPSDATAPPETSGTAHA